MAHSSSCPGVHFIHHLLCKYSNWNVISFYSRMLRRLPVTSGQEPSNSCCFISCVCLFMCDMSESPLRSGLNFCLFGETQLTSTIKKFFSLMHEELCAEITHLRFLWPGNKPWIIDVYGNPARSLTLVIIM